MSYKTTEHCDHCNKEIGWHVGGDYNWQGIRIEPMQSPYDQKIDTPSGGDLPKSFPAHFRLVERIAEKGMGGYGGNRHSSIVLPGVVCSYDCLKEWMLAQMNDVAATTKLNFHREQMDKLAEQALV